MQPQSTSEFPTVHAAADLSRDSEAQAAAWERWAAALLALLSEA
jgi:hypothetical protein